jgi:hypothetical protein
MKCGCLKKYSTNFSDTRGQVSLMPGVFDADANTLTFSATSPFLILGLAGLSELPAGETPSYPNSFINVFGAAIQNANSQWLQALFIAMGFANAQDKGVSNGMTAYASSSFAEYMYRYLNPAILGGWYYLYVAPTSEIIQFWTDEVAIAQPDTMRGRLRALEQYLFENSSLPLWDPPGKYIINLDPLVNTEPYITDLLAYMAANANVVNILVEQQNSPDLIEDVIGNPLANTINSINFAGEIPDAILWT